MLGLVFYFFLIVGIRSKDVGLLKLSKLCRVVNSLFLRLVFKVLGCVILSFVWD